LNIKCKYCHNTFNLSISQEDYRQIVLLNKGIIQHTKNSEIIDLLEPWEREMIISQTCDNCWKNMYGDN
jgi:hypothetical protein